MKPSSLTLAAALATASLLALAGARADLAGAAFPGANGKIAFMTLRDGNYEIYSMNPDGTNQTNLTNNGCIDAHPAWSPDGSTIAFVSSRQFCGSSQLDLWVMSASGGSPTKVTNIARSPTWAPDGQRIAYLCGDYNVCVVNADGSGETLIHVDTGILGRPAWSPDGSTIAFDRTVALAGIQEILAMNPDGTNVRPLTAQGGLRPNWSPDGTRIAYTSLDSSNNRQIFVMAAAGDTGGRTQLTFTSGYNIFGERITNDFPAWSPDGLEIAFDTNRDGDNEVYTMKSDGSLQIAVSGSPALDAFPDWQVAVSSSGADHDVGIAGGGFHTDGHVTLSREGPGPFPIKIKVKNFGDVQEDIGYAVSSSEPVTLSAACSGTVAAVQPRQSVIVSTCTVTYLDAADPDPTLTLTTHGAAGSTDSNPSNNTKQQAVVINP